MWPRCKAMIQSGRSSPNPEDQRGSLTTNQKKKRRKRLARLFKKNVECQVSANVDSADAVLSRCSSPSAKRNPSSKLALSPSSWPHVSPRPGARSIEQRTCDCDAPSTSASTATHQDSLPPSVRGHVPLMEGLSSHQPTCSASKDAQSLPGFLSTKGRHLRKGETGQRHLYGTTAELEQPAKRLCRAGGVSRQESRPHEIRLPVGTAGIQPLRDSSAFEPSAQAEQLVCGRRICVDLDPSGGSGGRQEAEALVCRWDLSSAALVIACQLQFSSWVHAEAEGREGLAREEEAGAVDGMSLEELSRGKKRHIPVHGNYHHYYGYRLGQHAQEDPRLQVLDKRWFVNKRCLDIGCNEGTVTRAVAARFGCRSMTGVDIDPVLVAAACRTLVRERGDAEARVAQLKKGAGGQSSEADGSFAQSLKAARRTYRALQATWFQQGDFVADESLSPASFDTILCLSVTKWVHLNGGDEALCRLFTRIRDLLVPGGFFVLEPQDWRSYRQARSKLASKVKAAGVEHHPLESLQLRPEAFPSYLCNRLGFKLLHTLEAGSYVAGFGRTVFVFQLRAKRRNGVVDSSL